MIAIGHTSVGVIIGVTATQLLPASIPLPAAVTAVGLISLASHYVMDLIPHGHYNFNKQQLTSQQKLYFSLDFILPIFLITIYLLSSSGFSHLTWLVGAGITGAQLPDLLMGLRSKELLPNWNWLRREALYHSQTHWHNPTNKAKATNEGGRRLGLSDIWQVAVLIGAIYVLIRELG